MRKIHSFFRKAAQMKDAWAALVIISAGILVTYSIRILPETHPLALFSYLYSTFALVLLVYKMGQWLPRLNGVFRRWFPWYDRFYQDHENFLASRSKGTKFIYVALRVLTTVCAIFMFLLGEYMNCMLAILTLILFTLPDALSKNFGVRLPSTLESIIYCFIFCAEVLGEINNFYGLIPGWDTMLHTINGFLCAAIGFALVDMLNRNSKRISLSPSYLAVTAFCFSMTVGVCWEFIEFFGDQFFMVDMQKDTIVTSIKSILINPAGENIPVFLQNIDYTTIHMLDGSTFTVNGGYLDIGIVDTMKDLLVNLIGALTFSVFGYFYVKQRDRNTRTFVTRFIPVVEHSDPIEVVE